MLDTTEVLVGVGVIVLLVVVLIPAPLVTIEVGHE